jgi:hypothetical protein
VTASCSRPRRASRSLCAARCDRRQRRRSLGRERRSRRRADALPGAPGGLLAIADRRDGRDAFPSTTVEVASFSSRERRLQAPLRADPSSMISAPNIAVRKRARSSL